MEIINYLPYYVNSFKGVAFLTDLPKPEESLGHGRKITSPRNSGVQSLIHPLTSFAVELNLLCDMDE